MIVLHLILRYALEATSVVGARVVVMSWTVPWLGGLGSAPLVCHSHLVR